MSYPEPVYHGESGEVSAVVRPSSAAPELDNGPIRISYLTTGAGTGGKFGLYRVDFTGPEAGANPHFHRSMTESFFVLSGTMRLHNGKRWIDAGAGDLLHVPEGGVHGFRNESGEPTSVLILFAPGAPREEYFERLPEVAAMTEEERLEFNLRHDSFFV